MKKFLKNYLGSTCLIIVLVLVVLEIKFHIQDVKRHNAETIRQEKEVLNQEFCECLYMTEYGVDVTEDKVNITYLTYSENRLIQDLSYYNRNNEGGMTLTVEDVMTEYDNFCNNTENYERLQDFNEFCKDETNERLLEEYRNNLMYFYRRDYTGEKKAFDDTIYTGGFAGLASEEMWELCDAYFAWAEELSGVR